MVLTKDIPISPALAAYFSARCARDDGTGCVYWMGTYDRQGYGLLRWQGTIYRAHRVAYCLHYGVVNFPAGLVTDHLCRVPPCVEWSHLEAVTSAENTRRGCSPEMLRTWAARRRARTHCRQGHALVGTNRIVETQKGGIRQRCRICTNAATSIRVKRWRARHREMT